MAENFTLFAGPEALNGSGPDWIATDFATVARGGGHVFDLSPADALDVWAPDGDVFRFNVFDDSPDRADEPGPGNDAPALAGGSPDAPVLRITAQPNAGTEAGPGLGDRVLAQDNQTLNSVFSDSILNDFADARGATGGFSGRFIWRGPQEVVITHDGIERTFIIDVPKTFNPNDPSQSYAAVLAFHGGEKDALGMAGITGFSVVGNERDFIAAYPSAVTDQWNDGRETTQTGIDDVGFVQAMIAELAGNWMVDTGRIFATGVSSGGMFVQRLATEVPELFQGYGVVSANLPAPLEGAAHSDVDEPMIFFHGTQDQFMPYEGGTMRGGYNGLGAGGTVLGGEATADYWALQNETVMGSFEELPDIADDGMTSSRRVSQDGSVAHYVVDGGDHQWPGMTNWFGYSPGTTQDINATEIMVDFFSDYGL